VPLYEYQCPKCGVFELIRKFADEPLTACPTCGGEVQKLASAPAIQFKGTGWYITDYARKPSGDGKSQSSDSKSGEGKSDSKPGEAAKGSSGDAAKSSQDASSATPASTSKGDSKSGSGSSK
jgi:putative FmdB family regulatory protein